MLKEFTKGVWKDNPVLRLGLGFCPTLAVTTAAVNAIGMGLATTFVLLGSNVVIALVNRLIPDQVRIPSFIVIIASFVTVVEMVLHAFFLPVYEALGIFIPLIVVNCIILGRAEGFASRNPVVPSILDALGMGLGFTLGLLAIGSIREALGNGTIFSLPLFSGDFQPALVMILPPGALVTMGFLLAGMQKLERSRA